MTLILLRRGFLLSTRFEQLHSASFIDCKGQRKLSSLIRKADKPNRWTIDAQDKEG